MEIKGKVLQIELLQNLKTKIDNLKSSGVLPGIAIVTLGSEEAWEAYVGQKIKLAKELEIEAKLVNLRPSKTEDVLSVIEYLNDDPTIHGLIVQRPFPTYIDTERVIQKVSKEKDIDGFRNDSAYQVPVWLAVKQLLTQASRLLNEPDFQFWLSNQSILIIGKGETAGKPVAEALGKMKIKTEVMDSKTSHRDELFRNANIIIFATGRRIEVPFNDLKKGCILIGIGLHRENGKLEGDFNEFEAKSHGLYYTPSPGGVGPLNLYYLFENLIAAAEHLLDRRG
jgi:methylenetetrahydrofolate dehydrogenase (NADP+)/methenyltetrahydrofolate cyclohydrolase